MEPGYSGAAPASEARLVGILGPYTGQTFRVLSAEAVIGRELGLHVSLPQEDTVSRRHAVLVQRGAGWVLRDEGSSNGTWVNGVRVQEQTLLPGDFVRLGQSEFRFEMEMPAAVPEAVNPVPPPGFGTEPSPAPAIPAMGDPAVFGGGTPGAAPPFPPPPGTGPIGQPGAPGVAAPPFGTYSAPPYDPVGPAGPAGYTAQAAPVHCASCGALSPAGTATCVRCGSPLPQPAAIAPGYPYAYPTTTPGCIQKAPGSHSPVIAVLLSVFCCSVAGQFYNGQFLKGIIMLVAAVGLAVVTGGLTALLTWPLFAVDAGMVASRLNRGEPVSEWQFF